MFARRLVVALFATVIAACSSLPLADKTDDEKLKTFATKPDVAAVYIYYSDFATGVVDGTNIAIDGKPYGQIRQGTYLYAELAPGAHTIEAEAENTDTIDVDVQGGNAYYVWQEVRLGWVQSRVKLHLVDETEGKRQILRWTRLVPPTYVAVDQRRARAAGVTQFLGMRLVGALLMPAPATINLMPR